MPAKVIIIQINVLINHSEFNRMLLEKNINKEEHNENVYSCIIQVACLVYNYHHFLEIYSSSKFFKLDIRRMMTSLGIIR